jgi:hypothetical protein
MDVAREAMGPLSRALEALTNSSNGQIAALASLALKFGAAAGLLVILGKATKDLSDRGVEVINVGEAWSGIMDRLALSFGGTTKAVHDGEEAVKKFQQAAIDLDPAARAAADGLALLEQNGLKVVDVIAAMQSGIPPTVSEMAKAESASFDWGQAVRSQADAINKALNELRITSPKLAEELGRDWAATARAASENLPGATEKWHKLTEEILAIGSVVPDVVGRVVAAHKELGDKAGPELAKFTQQVDLLAQHEERLRDAGFTEAQVWEKLKSEYAEVAKGAALFSGQLDLLGLAEQKEVAQVRETVAVRAGLSDAIDKNAAKIINEAKEVTALNTVIEAHNKSQSDRLTTIRALLPAIDTMIAKIDKQRDSDGKLDASQQALLDSLQGWRSEIGKAVDATDKLDKLVASHEKTISALRGKYDDLTLAYERNRQKAIQTSSDEINAAERQEKQIEASIDGQITALEAAHRRGEISNSDYSNQVAALQLEEITARNATWERIDLITVDEQTKLSELQAKYTEATNGIVLDLLRQGETLASSKVIHDSYTASVQEEVTKLVELANKQSDAGVAAGLHTTAIKTLGKGLDEIAKGSIKDVHDGMALTNQVFQDGADKHIPAVSGALGGLREELRATAAELRIVIDLAGQISISNTGGEAGGGGEGGP